MADVSFFVGETHPRRGIGTALLRESDRFLAGSPFERSYCFFTENEETAEFLKQNGYRYYLKQFDLERPNTMIGGDGLSDTALLKRGIVIRNYTDEDYLAYHNVSDVAFFLLREKLGLQPPYYLPLNRTERKRLAKGAANRYVMVVDGVVAAIGAVSGEWVHLLAVRPDLQRRGYGRIMASYLNNLIVGKQISDRVKIAVVAGNLAQKLYESLGFRAVKTSLGYQKFYKEDSRPKAPEGYQDEEEILRDLRLYGKLKEKWMGE